MGWGEMPRAMDSHTQDEILPFATTWKELEGIMLSELSQRQIPHDLIRTWNQKENESTKSRVRRRNGADGRGGGYGLLAPDE